MVIKDKTKIVKKETPKARPKVINPPKSSSRCFLTAITRKAIITPQFTKFKIQLVADEGCVGSAIPVRFPSSPMAMRISPAKAPCRSEIP